MLLFIFIVCITKTNFMHDYKKYLSPPFHNLFYINLQPPPSFSTFPPPFMLLLPTHLFTFLFLTPPFFNVSSSPTSFFFPSSYLTFLPPTIFFFFFQTIIKYFLHMPGGVDLDLVLYYTAHDWLL